MGVLQFLGQFPCQLARSTHRASCIYWQINMDSMAIKQKVKTSGITPCGTPQRMTESAPHAHILVFTAVFPVHKVDGRLHYVAVERLPQVLQRRSKAHTHMIWRQRHTRKSSHLLDALPLLFQTCKLGPQHVKIFYICQFKITSQKQHAGACLSANSTAMTYPCTGS